MKTSIFLFPALLAILGFALVKQNGVAQNLAGDMALSKILIENQNWEMVAEGYQFTDAACSDAEGNFYFSDVARGSNIFRIDAAGKISDVISNAPKVSGLKFGPDKRLYACQGGLKRLVAFDFPSGNMTVLATNVQPNDLVVTEKGFIYFTETGKKQVIMVTTNGTVRVVDTGINKPNGITLSPDHGTLVVSDYGGSNLWTFRIEIDGSLSAKAPYMTVRLPLEKTDAASDGMTTDVEGRYYVTSVLGVQMFDATGRLGGVIARPQPKGLVSVCFAGPGRSYLYVACSDKIYRRKTQTQGARLY